MHSSPETDTTYVLAIKSVGLLHSASHLFDRPEASYPIPTRNGPMRPSHIPSLAAVQHVETALSLFRKRIPAPFVHPPLASGPLGSPADPSLTYDGARDPWWIMLHVNLYTAEMIMYREMAHHHKQAYETSVSCARAIVGLVKQIPADCWVHVDMIVALDISLASRFLYKEAMRLSQGGQPQAAMAAEEAEILRQCLGRDYGRWLPMASLHSLIVQRVREGWPEKDGEYERL